MEKASWARPRGFFLSSLFFRGRVKQASKPASAPGRGDGRKSIGAMPVAFVVGRSLDAQRSGDLLLLIIIAVLLTVIIVWPGDGPAFLFFAANRLIRVGQVSR